MQPFETKPAYTMQDLVEIVRLLRAPDGCPWDRQQTHHTLRTGLVEECYEVLEAIDAQSTEKLCEELGDVLLQVVFHAQLEAEIGAFTLDEVCDGICKKLIYRHPHVFSADGEKGLDPAAVLQRWDKLKDTEKNIHTASADMAAVPDALPALLRAKKLQKRAARYGYGSKDAAASFAALQAALAQMQAADATAQQRSEAFGKALFYLTDAGRQLGLEAEETLRDEANDFVRRTAAAENTCNQG